MTTDYEQSGISLDPPGVRIDRMREAIEVCKALWSQDTVDYSGTYYQLRGARCRPVPHTPGGPPLTIGGGGKKVLTIAAQHASIIGVNPEMTSGTAGAEAAKTAVASRYLERIEWIRQAAGDRFPAIELQVLCQIESITTDREALAKNLAPALGIDPSAALHMPIVLAGTVEQIIDDLIERRETFGFSYIVLHNLVDFAPIVAKLAGT